MGIHATLQAVGGNIINEDATLDLQLNRLNGGLRFRGLGCRFEV